MTIEAVVFDMDGVLIDSEVIWQRVREDFAAERGLPWRQQDQEALMGCSTEVWSVRMCERLALTDMSPAELAADILGRVQRAFETDLPVRPGPTSQRDPARPSRATRPDPARPRYPPPDHRQSLP